MTKKEGAFRRVKSPSMQISSNGSSDRGGQWQQARALDLAARNYQGSLTPMDIVQPKLGHLANSQATMDQTKRDGVVSAPNDGRPIKGIEKTLNILRAYRLWNPRLPPKRDGGRGCEKPAIAKAFKLEISEVAPQGRNDELRGPRSAGYRPVGNKIHQVARLEIARLYGTAPVFA